MENLTCPKDAADIARMNSVNKNERIAQRIAMLRIMLPFALASFAYPVVPWLSRAARMKGLGFFAICYGLE
jgi:hypothetical protein